MNSNSLPDSVLKRMSPADRKSLGKSGRTHDECRRQQEDVSEKEIHRQIDQWLRSKDIVFQHERMDGKTRGTVGWPDFTFVWIREHAIAKKFPIGCEVKRPGENPTKEQLEVHDRMQKNGWTVLVVHSLQELIEGLKNL